MDGRRGKMHVMDGGKRKRKCLWENENREAARGSLHLWALCQIHLLWELAPHLASGCHGIEHYLDDGHRLLDTQFCHTAHLGDSQQVAGMDDSVLPLMMGQQRFASHDGTTAFCLS
eukprot:365432-Chlamydomonas_euryale.AAC.3